MTKKECLDRAKEEVNNRRLKGLQYSCEVSSLSQDDGSLYEVGQQVKINDDYAGVRGIFLLKSIINQSPVKNQKVGSLIALNFTLPDGYKPQDVLTQSSKRKSVIA